jgi:hypothetical protein
MTSPQAHSMAPATSPLQRLIQWIAANPFFTAGFIYLIITGFELVFSNYIYHDFFSEWDEVFVYAGGLLRHGGDIYSVPPTRMQQMHPFTYPPFHALMAVPFTFLPPLLSRFAWFGVDAAALSVLWIGAWRISGGRPLNRGRATPVEAIICILGLIAGMRYVQGNFGHQQSDVLIDGLLVAGALAWTHDRDFLAGGFWGFAAAFKGPPLLMAPYLVWRGRWGAAIWMVIVAIGLNLLPDLVHRAPQGIWLTQWYSHVLQPKSGDVGAWYVDVTINQSIAGAAHRWFTTNWWIEDGKFNYAFHKSLIPPGLLKLSVYAIEALLAATAAWAMGRPFRRERDSRRLGLECSLVFILMLLLSPMSHKTHFGILILPGFFVARMAIEEHDRVAAVAMGLCVVSIGILDRNFFGSAIGDMFAWYGSVMWGAVALGVACFYALARTRSSVPTPPAAKPLGSFLPERGPIRL